MTEPMTMPAATSQAPLDAAAASSEPRTGGEQVMTLHAVPATAEPTISEPAATGSTVGSSTEDSVAVGESVDVRERARAVWRESVAEGQPLTGLELGARFDRSQRWGRARIAEVRHTSAGTDTAGTTVRPARRRRAGVGTPRGTAHAVAATTATRHTPNDAAPSDTPGGAGNTRPAGEERPATRDVPAAPAAPGVPVVVLPGGARLVAWAGFLFGTVISVAANVLHAWLPTLAGEAGAPGLAPQVGAAVWPIALVISVEVLSRVPWRPGWTWQLARYGGAGVVAVGAAVISYGHLHGVLAAWGYGTTGAAVGPLVVDGLMTISGFALLAMSNHTTTGNGKAVSR